MLALARSGVCVSPKFDLEHIVKPEGAQAFVDRAAECHVEEHGGHLTIWPLVVQDLQQLAHQHTAIARVFAGDADPRDRSDITAAAECRDVPGSSTARDVDTTDERIVVEALRFALLRFLDAVAVDELELVGRWREAADADANEVAVNGVGQRQRVARLAALYCANPTWIVTVAYTVTVPV